MKPGNVAVLLGSRQHIYHHIVKSKSYGRHRGVSEDKQQEAGRVFSHVLRVNLSCVSPIGMEAIKNLKMVEAAREEAKRILTEDLTLTKYPALKSNLDDRTKSHFE